MQYFIGSTFQLCYVSCMIKVRVLNDNPKMHLKNLIFIILSIAICLTAFVFKIKRLYDRQFISENHVVIFVS
jgi:hypothetical protein